MSEQPSFPRQHARTLRYTLHMRPQEQVAEKLLLLQVEFLTRCLGVPRAGG